MNNQVMDMLVEEYMKPATNEWEKNGTSEEFIRGWRSAIEKMSIRLFGEDSIQILVDKIKETIEDGKVSGSEENM